MATNLTDISGFVPAGNLGTYLAQVGSFEEQCQIFMLADLAKSGLSPVNFPCAAGTIDKYDGIPYYSIKFPNSNYAMDRVRRDKNKYIFPAGHAPELYYPMRVSKETFSTANYTAVVEGQKKAAAFAHATGIPAIGLPGCSGWSEKLPSVTRHLEHRTVRNELLSGVGPGRFHIICVDGDWSTNEQIAQELGTYASEVASAGATPIAPDFGQNQLGERRGADDWLVETYKGVLPAKDQVLRDILSLPRIALTELPVLAGFYTADIEKFNRGHVDDTDRGNATLLLRLYGAGNLLFLQDTRVWAVYTDETGKWVQYPDKSLELVNPAALQYKHLEARLWKQSEAYGLSADQRDALEKQAYKAGRSYKHLSSNTGRQAALADLQTRDGVRASSSLFDTNEFILNTPSGVVDLRTGLLRPVERSDYVLRSTAVPYQEDEPAEPSASRIKQWLSEITADAHGSPSLDEQEHFLRRQGAALRGGNPTTSLEILHGVGATGKSTWMRLDLALLGDYGTVVPAATILSTFGSKRDGEAATPFLASTRGRRKVYMAESKDTAMLDEAQVKLLTGGDSLAARGMYADASTFTPTATFLLVTNNLPNISHLDEALTDRLAVSSFKCRWRRPDAVQSSDADKLLPLGDRWFIDHAHNDKDALRWLLWAQVQAGVRYYTEGTLGVSHKAAAAVQVYTAEQDQMAQFVAGAKLVISKDAKIPASELYILYGQWCQDQNYGKAFVPTQRTFTKRLLERYPALYKKGFGDGGYMHIFGIAKGAA